MNDAIALAVTAGTSLQPGTLNLVVKHGEHVSWALIHPSGREKAFQAGEQRAIDLGNTQRFLRHMTRLLRGDFAAVCEELGDCAAWFVMNSDQWPILQPHAEAGLPVVVSIERRSDLRLRIFFEVWRSREAA